MSGRPLHSIRAFCLLMLLFSSSAHGWWNEDWRYRKPIDISIPAESRASASLQTIPIRLHTANFPYFFNLAEGGADIRLIAADDMTPLPFHIETLDIITGLGLLWVQLPENLGNTENYRIWLYYDNPDAVTTADSTASFDQYTAAVYHFAEDTGLPRDSTAYAHHSVSNSALTAAEGYHANGLRFDSDSSLILPDSPAMVIDSERGFSFESWIKIEDSGAFLSYTGNNSSWSLEFDAETPVLVIDEGDEPSIYSGSKNILGGKWHYLAVNWGEELQIYLDGIEILIERLPVSDNEGVFTFGTTNNKPGFTGNLDEVRITNLKRAENWFNFSHGAQDLNTTLITYLSDEKQDISTGSKIFASLWPLMNNIGLAGWIVIGVLVVIGLAAADVMLIKLYSLSRIDHANKVFSHDCHKNFHGDYLAAIDDETFNHSHSPHWRILKLANHTMHKLPHYSGQIPALYVDAVRSALDESLMKETNRLNAHMVWINIAVSGGPFLGLLGTVIGVMITFATIAQSGDVNVNTIAPGVAAALSTTVLGLIVAIPALFGYNFLAGKIGRVIAELENYADKLAVMIAIRKHDNTPVHE